MEYVWKELTAPAAEPVTLELAKKHLAIDHSDDDALITKNIKAARKHCETFTGRIFGSRTFVLQLTAWPEDGSIRIPVEPVTAVGEVHYMNDEGDEVIVAADQYRLWLDHSPPLVRFVGLFGYPALDTDAPAPLEVEFTAGETAPETLEQAILLTLEYWHKFPGGEDALGHLSRGLPSGAVALLSSLWTGAL